VDTNQIDQWLKNLKQYPIRTSFILIVLIIIGVGYFYLSGFFSEYGKKHAEHITKNNGIKELNRLDDEKNTWLNRLFKIDKKSGGTIHTCDGENCVDS